MIAVMKNDYIGFAAIMIACCSLLIVGLSRQKAQIIKEKTMTQEDLIRFNRGITLFAQIDSIKSQLGNIEYIFAKDYQPRTESGWKLSAIINDSIEDLNLSSEEFWECIKTIKDVKLKKLEQLQQEFDKL